MDKNYIREYYDEIQSGRIVVGKWVKLCYDMVIKGLEQKLFFYDANKAKAAIVFCEHFVHHHKGALAPQVIKLELWEKAIIACIFGIIGPDGYRQFREVFIVVARKNGKTLLAAAIAEYMTFCDGEYGAEIYFTAPKLDQARLCFDAFYQSIKFEPKLNELVQKRRTDIYVDSLNATAKPLAFSAKKSDGFNISLGVCDEIASWQGDASLKFYNVLKSSQGARLQPLLLSISTAGYINDSIYDDLMHRSTAVLNGSSTETRLLPLLYIIDDPAKWNDMNELQKSNPNLGVSVSREYLEEEIRITEGSLAKKAEFLTKYCNIKQNSSQAWLDAVDIAAACGPAINLEDFRGCYCVGGIDLSMTTDLTACCAVIERDGKLNVVAKFFLPEAKLEEATARDNLPYRNYVEKGWLKLSGDNIIEYQDCHDWYMSLVKDYGILPLQIGYDRYSSQYLVKDLTAEGFHMDDVWQGYNLSPVLVDFEGLIKDRKVNIGDNDLLKVHLLNAALKADGESDRCKLVKLTPNDHIDGTAALIDALTVRQKWYGEIGRQLKNER